MSVARRRHQRSVVTASGLQSYLKLAPNSSYYFDIQAAPLDPQSQEKSALLIQGIRSGTYGNNAAINTEYGYPEYHATASTPRIRVLKLDSNGASDADIDPLYGWYSNTSYGAKGIFLDVPVESWYMPATGTDGSMSIWDKDNDCLHEIWQAHWVDGAWVPGGPNGVTYDPNAPGKVLAGYHGARYDGVSTAVQGAYPQQNWQWYFGLSASKLMGTPFAIKIWEIENGLNPDGTIRDINCIKHALAFAVDTTYTLSNKANVTPVTSWPAEYSDNWLETNPPKVAIAYGQTVRFSSSIDFTTWVPDYWQAGWNERDLSFARIIGHAIQRYGVRLIDMGGGFGIAVASPQPEMHARGYNPWDEINARFDDTHLPGRVSLQGIFQLSHLPWEQIEIIAMDYGKTGGVPLLPS